jgi:glycosyltransferase involved in cell wall biosynthesis
MRIVICRSNPIAPDPRVERIANSLFTFGHTVTVLGWDRSGQLPTPSTLGQQDSSIQIVRLPIVSPFGRGLENLPNLLRWQWGLFRWLIQRRNEFDILHACDFDTVLPALICKKLWGKKVIYDIFDFYADHLRATPEALKRIVRTIDIHAIGMADALILADDSRRAQISGAKPKRSAVIYNSPSEIPIQLQNSRQHSDTTRLRIAYVGLLQVERGLMEMLDLLKLHPEWELDLAGFGGDEEQICAAAKTLPNVFWHARVPYDKALQLSQAADVLFATYNPIIPNHRYSSPNKVFEAMLLGKPIIVSRGTNMDRLIQESNCGIVVEYGDISGLELALLQLQTNIALRQQLGENARRAYENQYSWTEMQARLKTIYAEVAGAANPQ